MGRRQRQRSVKTRRPKELDLALALTIIWAAMVLFFVSGAGSGARQDLGYAVVFTIIVTVAWWWAGRTIRARNAAGKTLAQLQEMSPDHFEEWTAARFRDRGYSVKLTGTQGDHGVDLIAERPGEIAVVQCKNYKSWSVGEPVLRDLLGSMHHFGASRAYLATTGRLTRAATAWVVEKPITVWDGDYLARLSLAMAQENSPLPGRAPSPEARAAGAAHETTEAEAASDDKSSGSAPVCPRCGSTLVERRNRRTGEPFLACPAYPSCRHTQPVSA